MRQIMSFFLLSSLIFALSAAKPPLGDVTITTPDRVYVAKSIAIKQVMGEPHVEFEDDAKKTHLLKCSDVVDIAMAAPGAARAAGPGDVQITLWTGDTLFGALAEPEPNAVKIQSAALGATTVKLEHVESIRFLANRGAWQSHRRPAKLDKDMIVTRTLDERGGTIASVGKDGVVYKSKALKDREVTVKVADCAVIHIMDSLDAPPAAPKGLYAIVQMTDGTAVQGTLESMAAGVLTFKDLYGQERTVGAGSIAGFYFKNGRVIYLSDMAVAEAKEEANFIRDDKDYPSNKKYPYKRDRNVNDGAMKIGGQEFRKGIGVHSKSELTYDLGKQYRKFEALIGIDDCSRQLDNPCGSVVFAVIADGVKVFDSGAVTWKDAKAKPVSVPVEGVAKLTLLVDWGDEAEYGDCANWAVARVIK